MNVGKDPFPRDEVTGLAAFDHIEPVGALNVVPDDESVETPVLSEEPNEATSGLVRAPSASNSQRERVDATLPMDLSAMPHWHETAALRESGSAPSDEPDDADDPPDLGDVHPSSAAPAAQTPTAPKPSTLDAMFGHAAGAGWDEEDETTRVHSHPAGAAPGISVLDMEWDEEEPATEMRPFALFDAPPVAARHDWPEWNGTEDETSTFLPRGATSIRSSTPTIRTTTPPLQTALPPIHPRTNALSGGRPSPFPTSQVVAAPEVSTELEDRDPARASGFEGLVPLPAPQLPAAASAPLSKTGSERSDLSAQTPARFLDALRAGHRPSIAIAASGFVGLLALVFIVRAITAGGAGAAVLEVSPADARVQVDGEPVSGTSSPYTVSELTPGNHALVVKKPGYTDYRGTFAVKAGESVKLPVIELAPNLRDVGFSVRSVPAGAAVWIDGEKSDQVTPAKLTGIKPGIHRLVLKHDGYNDYELQMFVPEATVLQLPAAELVALPTAPPDEATRAGRRTRRAASSDDLESSNARRARRNNMSEASDSERSSRSERASYTSSASSSYASRRRSRAAASDEVSSPLAAGSGKMGTLRLNSRPWAQVSVDGHAVGNTPQPNLQLSAGKHKIQLSNPQLGLAKTVTVTIKGGETLTQVVNLSD